MRALLGMAATLVVLGCGTDHGSASEGPGSSRLPSGEGGGAGPPPGGSPPLLPPSSCITSGQLQAWQQQIDLFDGGYRPTGSPAHEGYIALLTQELAAVGAEDVHAEPYSFTKWTPSTWSLTLLNGGSAGPVALSGYVPYSGSTGPQGLSAGLAYLPRSGDITLTSLQGALQDPAGFTQSLAAQLEATLGAASGNLAGKVVLFDLPRVALTLRALTGGTVLVNDPGHTLSMDKTVTRTDLSAMLAMPAMLNVLAAAGALGAIGILDSPEEAARAEYAPLFGILSRNLPAVYVDRSTGVALKNAVAAGGPLLAARLVLDASLAPATSENVVGVLPGASTKEILLSSHTDGPNSMEDNGPVAILALVQCFRQLAVSERPRTIRIVLSGGHFVGSRGLQTYAAAHASDLHANALAVLEVEHLGAREWAEVSPGTMALTGQPEIGVVYTWTNQPLVDASRAFANQFARTIVGEPPLLGEGQNYRVVPLIQFISMPEYLLVGRLSAITSTFTDYDLMNQQVEALAKMEASVASAPAAQLGVVP
jgi:hypothetical protein